MKYDIACDETDQYRGRSNRKLYRLSQDISGGGYTAPVGFLTDFVSAPTLLLKLLPLQRMARSSVIHDYLCNLRPEINKKDCDKIFRDLCKEDRVFITVRWICWLYLRLRSTRVNWPQPYIG